MRPPAAPPLHPRPLPRRAASVRGSVRASVRARARVLAAILAGVLAGTTSGGCAPGSARPSPPSPAAVTAAAAPIAPRELTADQQLLQVLDRLAFGPRPGDLARVRALGVDRWIDAQLHPERIDDAATEHLLSRYATLDASAAELVRDYPPPQLLERRRLAAARARGDSAAAVDTAELRQLARASARPLGELASARLARAVTSERQLQEVMVDFWLNHFNVFAGKGPERYFLTEYERDAIRPYALGRFRDLLGAVAHSPAMLFYLDNWESGAEPGRPRLREPRGAGAPFLRRGLNENYGRELLELHTLGVDGGYTQQDVIGAARAFTGWSIRDPRRGGGFVFRAQMHDAAEKVVLGHRLAAGRGLADGEEVLDIVARHPATARFIATKLVRRFVSDSAPPALVERATATFRRTDGDIREVVRTIVTSPEFFSRAAYRSKVKTPFELVASTLRALGAAPDTTPRTARLVARLGEPLYGHRDPNGYPDGAEAWINTGSILDRINFGLVAASGRLPGASLARWPLWSRLAGAPREQQVEGVIDALLGGDASADTRAVLLSGANPLLPDSGAAARPRDALAQLVGLALGSPEFQRK